MFGGIGWAYYFQRVRGKATLTAPSPSNGVSGAMTRRCHRYPAALSTFHGTLPSQDKRQPVNFWVHKMLMHSPLPITRAFHSTPCQEKDSLPNPSNDEILLQPTPKGPSFQRMKELPAHEFFGNNFFYNGKEMSAKDNAEERQKKFGNKTASDLLREARDLSELIQILAGTGIESSPVKQYWEQVFKTPENMLAGQQIALDCVDYLKSMSFYQEAMSFNLRHGATKNKAQGQRNNDIHIVLGSSGSGKTAFAWKLLADPVQIKQSVKTINGKEWCSIYIQAGTNFNLDKTIDRIKRMLPSKTEDKYDPNNSILLDINLALVIDEAAHLKGKYDTLESLSDAVNRLKEILITGSVRLILAGTGYDYMVDHISSQTEVFKYDMRPWSQAEVSEYVKRSGDFTSERDRETVKFCIQNYAVLSKLASNARMATILFTAENRFDFKCLSKQYDPSVVARLITFCAQSYICLNGLAKLNELEQKLVARAVLGQLDISLQNRGFVAAPTFDHVSLPGNDHTEIISAARSLVEQNYERGVEGKLKLIDESQPATFVSPAITVVIYMLLNASPTALAGWQLLEMIGALTLLQKAAIMPIERWSDETKRDFKRLQLDQLPTPLPATTAERNLRIPCKLRGCIWINGPRASFGDYFSASDKIIGQAKYVGRNSAKVRIDLFNECLKTGLLENDVAKEEFNTNKVHIVRVALLHALSTQAGLHHDSDDFKNPSETNTTVLEPEDHAYPSALLLRKERDPVDVLNCYVNHRRRTFSIGSDPPIAIDDKELLNGWELHFFTNAKSFEIQLSKGKKINIDRSNVDFHGEIVSDTEKEALNQWKKANLREDVVIRFFFAVKHAK